jgi:hypothetical protein
MLLVFVLGAQTDFITQPKPGSSLIFEKQIIQKKCSK